jgi:hypothetical protein
MAGTAEIPQIQDSHPIFQPQKPNSEAEGYEAFAKTLANIGSQTAQKAEQMVSEQSETMYINSVANVEQLKTSAQVNMLENPGNAKKIAEQTNDALNIVKQNAFVNDKDRTKLGSYISGASNEVDLKAVTTDVNQRKLEAGFTHYSNWPDQLKAYQSALLSDPDKAETLKNAMVSSLHGLVSTGAITPLQAGNSIKTMSDVADVAHDHYQMYGNANATAKDFHTVTSNPLNGDQAASPTAPVNEATAWRVDYYNGDKTFQGVKSSINNRMLPNPEAFDSLSGHQRQEAMLLMQGGRIADGMINSGEEFPAIQAEYKRLSDKNTTLSYREEGTKNALGRYVDELKNGNYLNVIGKTSVGNGIMQDYVARDAAIRNSPLDDAQKLSQITQNQDRMVNAAVAYGHAHNIPGQYIQPVPQADVSVVQDAFTLGNNPANVLSTLGKYSKQNQGYLAQAMKDPNQKMVVQALSNAPSTIAPQDQLDFIAANQKGRNWASKEIDIDKDRTDKKLASRILTTLAPAMRMVAQNYDYENAQVLQKSMLDTSMNYAKYIAQKDNNIEMKENKGFNVNIFSDAQWKQYADKAASVYTGSFPQQSGTNWVVNPQQLSQKMSNSELDTLAQHITNQGYDYLNKGRRGSEIQAANSRNRLRMIITPTNDVQAIDENGSVYYTTPLTSNLVDHARTENAKRQKVIAKQNADYAERNNPNYAPEIMGNVNP